MSDEWLELSLNTVSLKQLMILTVPNSVQVEKNIEALELDCVWTIPAVKHD
jgi:hypothetical protein